MSAPAHASAIMPPFSGSWLLMAASLTSLLQPGLPGRKPSTCCVESAIAIGSDRSFARKASTITPFMLAADPSLMMSNAPGSLMKNHSLAPPCGKLPSWTPASLSKPCLLASGSGIEFGTRHRCGSAFAVAGLHCGAAGPTSMIVPKWSEYR